MTSFCRRKMQNEQPICNEELMHSAQILLCLTVVQNNWSSGAADSHSMPAQETVVFQPPRHAHTRPSSSKHTVGSTSVQPAHTCQRFRALLAPACDKTKSKTFDSGGNRLPDAIVP
eukprot:239393-Pelagomonas_calceolata.AAC.2